MLKRLLIAFIFVFLILPPQALATFEMSLGAGYRSIDFGPMELGEEKTLSGRGGYEHQFNFTSDKGRTWYFKAQFLMPFTSGTHTIPPENFQWIVERVINGKGKISYAATRHDHDSLQQRILEQEGIKFSTDGKINLEKYRWIPNLVNK